MDMLQNLTQQQKDQMYAWLVEARELAMDEGSSDAKHAVFGKYKGRINNYLSAAGYDMKKEGEEWQKRIQAAKKENKSVFLHAFASWCHYCDYMRDSVYTTPAVAAYFNRHFISIRMDMEKEGRELNKKLRVANFPTQVFYDTSGTLVHRAAGKKDAQDLLATAATALDPEKRLHTYQVKFKAGKLSPEEAYTYFSLTMKAGLDNQPLINAYFANIPDSDFLDDAYWRILYDQYRDTERPLMQRFMKMQDELSAKYTADSVENRIISSYNTTLMMKVQKLDSLGYREQLRKIEAQATTLSKKIVAYAELNRFRLTSHWKEYIILAEPFVKEFCSNDYRRLNEIAQNFYERATDPADLIKALTWAQQSVNLMDNYRNNHTLAALNYKLKKKAEAKRAAEHAIEIAIQKNLDAKQTILLKEKIDELP
jgi:thiol-disulfide isomerase/thioredoxin